MTGGVSVLSHMVPAGAVAEWARLTAAVMTGSVEVPCAGWQRELWHGETKAEQAAAVRLCLECPVMVECAAYADAAGERWGVWGGVTERERRRAGRAEATA